MIYQQIPVRLQATFVSSPPAGPVDINTGVAPQFWRAKDTAVAFAVFDSSQDSVDLTNLLSLTLTVQADPTSVVPAFPPITVLAVDIVKTVSSRAWLDGLQQQATFVLTAAATDVSLGGEASAQYWLSVTGATADGARVVYAAGYVTFFDPGVSLPQPPYGYVSDHDQTNTAGNATISPSSLNHTEFVTVNGVARTSNIVLSVVGIGGGSVLRVYLDLTATPDVVLNFKSGDLGGTQVATITTGSVLNALLTFVFQTSSGEWTPINYALPST